MTTDLFEKLASGGPDPLGDYTRRRKADGFTTTQLTSQSIGESGAGFWADMARMGGATSENTVDIYVDSVAGVDANDGLTAEAALRTIAAIPLADNININLKRGSKWRERLAVEAYTGIVVRDYGSGALPVLDCSDVIPNSGWTQPNSGTYPNVWQITVTADPALAENFTSIWVNNVRPKFVATIALVNSTPGSYTVAGGHAGGWYGVTTTTFQLYSTTNPNTDGKTYEYAARPFGFTGSGGVIVSNIHARRPGHNNGCFSAGANARVTGCIFEDGSKHNAFTSPGTVMTDCVAWKCDWQVPERDGWMGIVAFDLALTGVETAIYIRCQCICELAVYNARQQAMTGFGCHTDGAPGSLWGRITYTDCAAQYCDTAFGGNDCLGIDHLRTHTKGCDSGIALPNGDGLALNSLTDCWIEESDGLSLIRAVQPNGANTTIDGLRVWQTASANHAMVYGGIHYTLRRSVLARTSPGSGYVTYTSCPGTLGAVFSGNVMWGPNTGFGERILGLGTATLDHNAYGNGNADMIANGLADMKVGAYLTAAQAAGNEVGSLSYAGANPFTNAPAGDFHLTGASGLSAATFGLERFPTYLPFFTAPPS